MGAGTRGVPRSAPSPSVPGSRHGAVPGPASRPAPVSGVARPRLLLLWHPARPPVSRPGSGPRSAPRARPGVVPARPPGPAPRARPFTGLWPGAAPAPFCLAVLRDVLLPRVEIHIFAVHGPTTLQGRQRRAEHRKLPPMEPSDGLQIPAPVRAPKAHRRRPQCHTLARSRWHM